MVCSSLFSQQWYRGEATVVGSENESPAQVRERAMQQARVNVLQQAGIILRSTQVRVQGELDEQVVDIYGAFAQSDARGIIVDERNLKATSSFVDVNGLQLPQIKVSLEGQIQLPVGEPDNTFEVELLTNKTVYVEGEDLELSIHSSQDGYMSLFRIKNDSCFILYPHPLLPKTKNNWIVAKRDIDIPPKSKPYSYELDLEGGDGERVIEFIVAVVTKENVPIGGMNNKREFIALREYNTWLAKISLDKRASASTVISIVKK
jgi:hypothetical protein